jgi:hypothetical protein
MTELIYLKVQGTSKAKKAVLVLTVNKNHEFRKSIV